MDAGAVRRFQKFAGRLHNQLGGGGGRISNPFMRPVRSLLIYAGAVFLGGALLAPWLWWLMQALAGHFPLLQSTAAQPFHRYVNRSLLLIALAGLWPFLRTLGLRTWADAGLCRPSGQWRNLGIGWGLGFGSLALVATLAIAGGARHLTLNQPAGKILTHLLNASLSAVVVAVFEELFFRGALLGALSRVHSGKTALVVSSAVYALLHFFARPEEPAAVDWTSGLALLPRMMRGFAAVEQLVPGFLNLTLAGMILGSAYQRTGTLYGSIGLHAGWIFWLKTYGFITAETPGANVWFWGSSKLIDGWLAFLILALPLFFWLRSRCSQPKTGSAS